MLAMTRAASQGAALFCLGVRRNRHPRALGVKNQMKNHVDEQLSSTRTGSTAPGAQAIGAQAIGAQAVKAQAIGSLAIGALAVGAVAIGALAIGRLVIGRLTIRRARSGVLEMDGCASAACTYANWLSMTNDNAAIPAALPPRRTAVVAGGTGLVGEPCCNSWQGTRATIA